MLYNLFATNVERKQINFIQKKDCVLNVIKNMLFANKNHVEISAL